MKEKIEKYSSLLEETTKKIKLDLTEYLKNYNYLEPNNDVQIIEIKSEKDLDKIIYGRGFYIILTNHNFEKNECEFQYKGLKAIYRGHSYFTKKRLLSHLANNKYNSNRKTSEPNYKVCLKIKDGINGININQEPYKNWDWIVIIHKMEKSTKIIREQTEKAFDCQFKKPIKSRERN